MTNDITHPFTIIVNSIADIKEEFEKHVGSDSDYFLIAASRSQLFFDLVPHEGCWETREEAVKWCFEQSLVVVYFVFVYDLYSPFETSFVRTVERNDFNDHK